MAGALTRASSSALSWSASKAGEDKVMIADRKFDIIGARPTV